MTSYGSHYNNLGPALDYLRRLIEGRIALHLGKATEVEVQAPELVFDRSPFASFLATRKPEYPEYVAVLLALAPHLQADFFDDILQGQLKPGEAFPIFGGKRGQQHRGLLPTGETLQFILAGNEVNRRIRVRQLFTADHWFARERILTLGPAPSGEPVTAGLLTAEPDFVDRMLTGRVAHPSFSPAFPAQLLETQLTWDDLVLPERSLREIGYLKNYLDHHRNIAGDPAYGRHSRRGYRALFHGPPGTGKTLTATLLGKSVDTPVFRVDLSMVVSKWIGETEKNLSGLFDRAESKGWILFFDEADALFSKRGEVKESRDKYANQETSFLLQRVENYDGLCILATNFRQNLDKAFTRRFESIVPFTPPTVAERLSLWENMLPTSHPLSADVDPQKLATAYEVSGATIANALRHAVYEAVAAGEPKLRREGLLAAVRREYEKEDRLFPAD